MVCYFLSYLYRDSNFLDFLNCMTIGNYGELLCSLLQTTNIRNVRHLHYTYMYNIRSLTEIALKITADSVLRRAYKPARKPLPGQYVSLKAVCSKFSLICKGGWGRVNPIWL